MHEDTKDELRKHLIGFVDTRTTDYAESTLTVEAFRYTDPDYLAREFRRVFRTHPMVVAHSAELPEPGSFVTVDHAGLPLLLVRQDDGRVRALLNICRHRGAKVELRPSGRRKMFNCPYHKWCYNRDGSIRHIPFDDGFVGLDRADHRLIDYPVDEYAGLVWVLAEPGAELDMAAHVGPELDRDLRASGIDDTAVFRRRDFTPAMNWKVVMDGLTDAYHLQFVHPETVGPFFHTNIYKVDAYGKNWRMAVARKGIEQFRDPGDGARVDLEQFGRYAISNITVYPGVVIAYEPSHFEVWAVRPDPLDLTRCRVTLMFLTHGQPASEKAERFYQKNWELLLRTVEQEDWVVAGSISAGLAAGAGPDLVLGRNEKATQLLHAQLARDVDG